MALSNNSFLSFGVVSPSMIMGQRVSIQQANLDFVYHEHPFYRPEIFKRIIRSLLDFWLQIIRGSKNNKSLNKGGVLHILEPGFLLK